MTFSTGIFLTAARLYEPLFRMLMLQSIYQFWGEIYSPANDSLDEQQIANDALSTFLSSSLNVELVYIILKSIIQFSESTAAKDRNNLKQGNVTSYLTRSKTMREEQEIVWGQSKISEDMAIRRECQIERVQVLKNIEITNVDRWNTAKVTDFIQKKKDVGRADDKLSDS